jgi:hypothetical protein
MWNSDAKRKIAGPFPTSELPRNPNSVWPQEHPQAVTGHLGVVIFAPVTGSLDESEFRIPAISLGLYPVGGRCACEHVLEAKLCNFPASSTDLTRPCASCALLNDLRAVLRQALWL